MNPRHPHRTTLSVHADRFSFALIVAQFNAPVTERLKAGALACLAVHGARPERIRIVECPGAFELPQVANLVAARHRPDAIICLGAVIRGGTPHFEYVAGESARGIQDVALRHTLPVVFGVLTTNTVRQAMDRVGGRHGHKGWDAALTAISMAESFRRLRDRR